MNAPDAAVLVRLQVMWSPDGNYLYSGARQDPRILCWDVRNSGQVLYAMHRSSGTTNQRLDFDIEPRGRHLATGACPPQPCGRCLAYGASLLPVLLSASRELYIQPTDASMFAQ